MNIILKITIIILLNFSVLFSEDFSKLYELYDAKDFETLKTELNQINKRLEDSPEIKFFNAIYMENGEEALKIYKDLFNSSDDKIKTYIAEKLSDYY